MAPSTSKIEEIRARLLKIGDNGPLGGYNSCGCNLKLSQVRSGSFGVDLGAGSGALWAPSRPQIDSKRPRPDLGQPPLQPPEL